MKLNRIAQVTAIAAAGTLALAACGSDNTTGASGSGGSAAAGCVTGQISASGSSAQKAAMASWTTGYGKKCGANITYDAPGSGAGVKSFTAGKTAFAGSDAALADDQTSAANARCTGGKAIDIPMVTSPIAVIYNLKGVSDLTLTPSAIAQIFSGKITKWNDPAIAKANSGKSLPSTTISTVHRSVDSGTTKNFTSFLSAAAKSDWSYSPDEAWKAPGGQGAADSNAIASTVKGTDGAISYVDYADAKNNKLNSAKIDFGKGAVAISNSSVGKAVSSAKQVGTGDDAALSLNYALQESGAYPLALVTYEITCTKGLPAAQSKLTKAFLKYTASSEGQSVLSDLGYVKLPSDKLALANKSIDAIS